MLQRTEVRIFKKLDENSWDTSYAIFNLSDFDESEGLETNKDRFSITFDNQNNGNTYAFNIDDRVEIYLWSGTGAATSNDLVIDGIITEVDYTTNDSGKVIKITGANRTQQLLGSLVLLTYTNNNTKPHEAIQEILNQVNNNNQAFSSAHPRYIDSDSSTLKETKSDGSTEFPTSNFVINYKTAYEAIKQVSSDEYTGDGEYVFWIDRNNKLNWTWKSVQIQSGYEFIEGDNVEDITVQVGTWGLFNHVIVDVGKDCYGHGNHHLQLNPQSIIEAGAKWKFLDRAAISVNLIEEQFQADTSLWTTDSSGDRTENFPIGYNFTMTFNEIDSSFQEQTNSWTVASDNGFNTAIRKRSRFEGKKIGKAFLDHNGEIGYKVSITMKGTLDFEKGLLAQVTAISAGISDKLLRVMEVSHSFNTKGWITKLNLEEDPELKTVNTDREDRVNSYNSVFDTQ